MLTGKVAFLCIAAMLMQVGNVGSCILEEIPVTEQFRLWADQCSMLFGGMDILTVDAIHMPDGHDCIIVHVDSFDLQDILEINDCASGLAPSNETEDMEHIAQLVLNKLAVCYSKSDMKPLLTAASPIPSPSSPTPTTSKESS